jgi:hypothetical protein
MLLILGIFLLVGLVSIALIKRQSYPVNRDVLFTPGIQPRPSSNGMVALFPERSPLLTPAYDSSQVPQQNDQLPHLLLDLCLDAPQTSSQDSPSFDVGSSCCSQDSPADSGSSSSCDCSSPDSASGDCSSQ